MSGLAFRYATSPDGTSLAYTRMGAGPALVVIPPVPFSSVSGDWSVPLLRDVYERLSRDFELILYDGRGTGASQRDVDDLGIEALTSDLLAVLDDAGIERAALLSLYLSVPPAVTVAARAPDRVSHLLLFGALVRGADALERPGTAALLSLIGEDWELFTRTAALDWMGWGVGEDGERVARSFRSATNAEVATSALAAYGRSDIGPLLPQVMAPTLVLHRRDGRQVPLERSTEITSALPNGRLHMLDGESATLFFDDPVGTAAVIARFVRPERTQRPTANTAQATLTAREVEVLRLIAAGESNQEIAAELGLSVHTVERHAVNIYRKIDARGRADATAWAVRNGLDQQD